MRRPITDNNISIVHEVALVSAGEAESSPHFSDSINILVAFEEEVDVNPFFVPGDGCIHNGPYHNVGLVGEVPSLNLVSELSVLGLRLLEKHIRKSNGHADSYDAPSAS